MQLTHIFKLLLKKLQLVLCFDGVAKLNIRLYKALIWFDCLETSRMNAACRRFNLTQTNLNRIIPTIHLETQVLTPVTPLLLLRQSYTRILQGKVQYRFYPMKTDCSNIRYNI